MAAREKEHTPSGLERSAWIALLATVALVPLAAARLPGGGGQLTYTTFGFMQTVTLEIGAAVTLSLWAAAGWRQARLVLPRLFLPVLVLALWAAVATAAGFDPLRSLLGKSTSPLSALAIAAYALIAFLAVQLTDTERRVRMLTRAVVYPGSAVALIALAQQVFNTDLFGIPSLEPWMVSRGFSTLGNPDHLGTYLIVPLVLSAVLSLAEKEPLHRYLALVSAGVLAAALTGTLTRGAWIGALIGLGAVVVLFLPQRANLARAAVLALAGVLVGGILVGVLAAERGDLASRFGIAVSPAEQSEAGSLTTTATPAPDTLPDEGLTRLDIGTAGRASVWLASVRIAAERPITGTGPAAFELGWYRHAANASSAGGRGALADDPHSVPLYFLATTGVPGALAWLVAVGWALIYGAKAALRVSRQQRASGKSWLYAGWVAAAFGLQAALLVGAIGTPSMMYAFLGLAVLARPSAGPVETPRAAKPLAIGAAVLAVLLVAGAVANLSPELTLAEGARQGSSALTGEAADAAPWNMDVQYAHYHLRVQELENALAANPAAAPRLLDDLAADLAFAGAGHPYELYYPSVRAQVLTRGSESIDPATYAPQAVEAADDALAVMPAHIPSRVNKALALSDLGRWEEMAGTLEDYWRVETASSYPGILYAQALALSGSEQEAWAVFDELLRRFPAESAAIENARQQTMGLLAQ